MKFPRHIPLLLAAAPLLGGCATALPASEGVIHYHHYPSPEAPDTVRSRLRLPMFFTGSPIPEGFDAFARRQFARIGDEKYDHTVNPKRFAGGLSISAHRSPSTWVNLSFGAFTLGVDVTTRLPRSWFATVNAGAFSGGEVILQKPVWLTRKHTLSLGGLYRLDRYAAEISYECVFICIGNPLEPYTWLNIHSAGGRVMWQRIGQTPHDILRLVASGGYSPTLHAPVVRLGAFIQLGSPPKSSNY